MLAASTVAALAALSSADLASLHGGQVGAVQGGAPAPPPLPAMWRGIQIVNGILSTSNTTTYTVSGERVFTTKFDEQGDLLWQRDVMTFDADLMALQPEFAELLGYNQIENLYNASEGVARTLLRTTYGPTSGQEPFCVKNAAFSKVIKSRYDFQKNSVFIGNSTEGNRTYSLYLLKVADPYVSKIVASIDWAGNLPSESDPFCGGRPFWAFFSIDYRKGAFNPKITEAIFEHFMEYQLAYGEYFDFPPVLLEPPANVECHSPQ